MNDRKAIANDFDLLNNYRLTKNEIQGREVHRLSSNYAYISQLSAIAFRQHFSTSDRPSFIRINDFIRFFLDRCSLKHHLPYK